MTDPKFSPTLHGPSTSFWAPTNGTSSYHFLTNGAVDHLSHVLDFILSMWISRGQDDGDLHLPFIQKASLNSLPSATGLAFNELYLGQMTRLSLTNFDRENMRGHQSLSRNQLECHFVPC